MFDETEPPTPPPLKRRCEECGTPLPPDAPGDVCPAYLQAIGQEAGEEGDEEGATITAGSGGSTVTSSSPVFKSTNNLSTGQQFGEYRIGKGGMGEVYEAEDVESDRQVAIKVLGTRIDSPEARKRFLREGQMAAAINHPNSVYIYGTEQIDGQ